VSGEPAAAGTPGGLTRNTAFAALSAASALLLLVVQALITKALGQEVFGRFNWVLTLALFGEALMDLGVHQITIRSIARDRSQATTLFHNSLALKAVTGAAMVVLLGGVSFFLAEDRPLWHASLVMLGVAVLRSYLLTTRGVLQGLERFGQDCVVVVGDRVLILAFTWLAILNGAGLFGLAAAFLLARIVTVFLALLLVQNETGQLRFSVDVALWRDLQREAFPIGVFLVVLNIYSYIDVVMLGVLSTFVDTGLYSSAYRLYEGLTYAPAVFSAVLTPRLANLWKTDRVRHVFLSRVSLAGAAASGLVVAGAGWFLARPLLVFVFGAEAEQAATALNILLLGIACVFVIWMLHAIALSVFAERLLLKTTVFGAVLNAGLNLFLIPRYGRNGAAFATVVGEFVTMVLLLWGVHHAVHAKPPGSRKE
jgi:O-antigen/teichoic acid export membrane protein